MTKKKVPEAYYESIAIDQLYISQKNPRKIDDDDLKSLQDSIQKDPDFLYRRPILVQRVNGNNTIYAGVQRFEACKRLGFKEVPCLVVDNLPVDILEYRMLLDNVHNGEWDEEKLFSEFDQDLQDMVFDFSDDDRKFNTKAANADKLKTIYTKLVFQMREDLNMFYMLMEDLKVEYPDLSASQRFIKFLTDVVENPDDYVCKEEN
jgi:hypothetical protein